MTKQTSFAVRTAVLSIVIKGIVTFYYNIFVNHSNLLKNIPCMPIDNTEHKNCLAFLKAAVNTNIDFIY